MDSIINRLTQKGSPFELQDAVINGIPCKIFPHGPKTLRDVFIKAASFKQNEFIVDGDVRLTCSQAIERAKYFAHTFQEKYGISKGERIAILMENSADWVIYFIAIHLAGAVSVTIHADSEKEIVRKAITTANCKLIISDRDNFLQDRINSNAELRIPEFNNTVKDQVIVIPAQAGIHKCPKSTGSDLPHIYELTKPDPNDEALISFTSGTTGTPKGVILSHRNMTTGLMNMMLGGYISNYRAPKRVSDKQGVAQNMQPGSLLLSPLSHIGGFSQIMLMCYLGGKIVLMPKWDAQKGATLIENEKVRSLNGATPEMVRGLLRANGSGDKMKSLSNINIHGISLNNGFLQEMEENYPQISIGTGYGMTETCGSISNGTGADLLNNPSWVGQVLPSVDIKVIDNNGGELLQGKSGEICVRGAMVMKEYCADSDKTNVLLKDGWLKTGDLGYMDEDRNLYITDRLKDLIVCNGKNISAGELERAASENEMIDEAVALAFPGSEKCENIVLAILPKKTENFNEQCLKQELSIITDKYFDKINIVIVDSLPRTASGKINRNDLMKQITSAGYFKLFDEDKFSTLTR